MPAFSAGASKWPISGAGAKKTAPSGRCQRLLSRSPERSGESVSDEQIIPASTRGRAVFRCPDRSEREIRRTDPLQAFAQASKKRPKRRHHDALAKRLVRGRRAHTLNQRGRHTLDAGVLCRREFAQQFRALRMLNIGVCGSPLVG